jgi:cell shape-determining protein MreD
VKLVLLICGLYLLLALQSSLEASAWGIWIPNLTLAGCLAALGGLPGWRGPLVAFLCGLLADGLSAGPLGLQAGCFALAAALLQRADALAAAVHPVRFSLAAALLAGALCLVPLLVQSYRLGEAIDGNLLAWRSAGSAAGTLPVALAMALVAAFGRRRSNPAERSAGAGTQVVSVSNRWPMLTE